MPRKDDHRVEVAGFVFHRDGFGRWVNLSTGIKVRKRHTYGARSRPYAAARVIHNRVEHMPTYHADKTRAIRAALKYWGFHATAITA